MGLTLRNTAGSTVILVWLVQYRHGAEDRCLPHRTESVSTYMEYGDGDRRESMRRQVWSAVCRGPDPPEMVRT